MALDDEVDRTTITVMLFKLNPTNYPASLSDLEVYLD
jgi:hypothetical protein